MTAPVEAAPSVVTPTKAGKSSKISNLLQNNNMKVAVRLKPVPGPPPGKKDGRGWTLNKSSGADVLTQKGAVRRVEGRTQFHFEKVFGEDVPTSSIYKSLARPMVHSVLDGKHATIFAYGQTGSGKTFTMQGDERKKNGQTGIIPLVAADVFRFMQMGTRSERDYVVKVSYIEIYNERIRDLLSEDLGMESTKGSPDQDIAVRTNSNGEVVMNVTQLEVQTVDDVVELLNEGNGQRVVAKTDMNKHSSRSHAVFRLTAEYRDKDENNNEFLRSGDFNLVDLAGSESVKVSNTNGLRQREGAKINQSLLSLSSVIHNLSLPEKKRPKHINFRDSKLTRILQPHLTGNAEMAVLCCVTPARKFVDETRSTLKFAARAKLIQVKPKVNEVRGEAAMIKKLQLELVEANRAIQRLEKDLKRAKRDLAVASVNGDPIGNGSDSEDFQDAEEDPTIEGPSDSEKFVDSSQVFQVSRKSSNTPGARGSKRSKNGKHMKRTNSDTNDSNETPEKTLITEDESYGGRVASYAEISMKYGSDISAPDTIHVQSIEAQMSRKRGMNHVDARMQDNRMHSDLSWDTMDLNTMKPGQPIRAMKALSKPDAPIPEEITIIASTIVEGNREMCMSEKLKDAEDRSKFLNAKLDVADDLVEAVFKDLDRARLCIHDLVYRNVKLASKLKEKQREVVKDDYQEEEVVFEQYWLLKGSMYAGLFFFVIGGYEYFMAAIILIWLILEANLSD